MEFRMKNAERIVERMKIIRSRIEEEAIRYEIQDKECSENCWENENNKKQDRETDTSYEIWDEECSEKRRENENNKTYRIEEDAIIYETQDEALGIVEEVRRSCL